MKWINAFKIDTSIPDAAEVQKQFIEAAEDGPNPPIPSDRNGPQGIENAGILGNVTKFLVFNIFQKDFSIFTRNLSNSVPCEISPESRNSLKFWAFSLKISTFSHFVDRDVPLAIFIDRDVPLAIMKGDFDH